MNVLIGFSKSSPAKYVFVKAKLNTSSLKKLSISYGDLQVTPGVTPICFELADDAF